MKAPLAFLLFVLAVLAACVHFVPAKWDTENPADAGQAELRFQ
jgi:hypothetical protein